MAFISTSLYSLVSIPLAVSFLDREEIGLWLIVNSLIGYLVWMDAGIGDATGRKIADAIAAGDRTETNRWWTTSIAVLIILGLLTAIATLTLAPFLPGWLKLGADQKADANWLFIGGGLVAAIGTPVRAYPGLLLAQHRFHWVSLVQAIIPWIQLIFFYIFLKMGFGVRSYLPSLAISQFCGWIIFMRKAHSAGGGFHFDPEGLSGQRVKFLFAYGGSIAAMGIAGAVLASLPGMVLARAGGLSLIPVFAFTGRCVSMFGQLSQRTTHAFYPGMQRLYVNGRINQFRERFRGVLMATVGVGTATAGLSLVINPTMISWLAKPEYYAGLWTNLWFAVGLIVAGITSGFTNLLQISGSMGQMAVVSLLQVILGAVTGWLAYQHFGLPGLAAAFAVIPPLCKGAYGLFRGARNCGFRAWDIGLRPAVAAVITCLSLILGATWIDQSDIHGLSVFTVAGKSLILPRWPDIMVGGSLVLFGCIISMKHLGKLASTGLKFDRNSIDISS